MHNDAQGREEEVASAAVAERKGPRDRSLPLLNWHGAYPDARHASKTHIPAHSHFGLGTNHTTSCFLLDRTSRDSILRVRKGRNSLFRRLSQGTQVGSLEFMTQIKFDAILIHNMFYFANFEGLLLKKIANWA